MKKKSLTYYDGKELDLIKLFKVIWHGKIKIQLTIMISFFVCFTYSYLTPNNSKFDNSTFDRINFINRSLTTNTIDFTNKLIINELDKKFGDYGEFLLNLKNTKEIRENLQGLSIEDHNKELKKYVNLLKINNKGSYLELNFKWEDIDEAYDILQNTIDNTLNDLDVWIFKELERKFEEKKKINLISNLKKLNFLNEQRWIAKELNISDLTVGYTGEPYYLRGYVAIDKEIEIIKKQQHQLEYLEKEINSLKKESIEWATYNIDSTKVKLLNFNTPLILIISILSGSIVGVFYVLLSDVIQTQTVSKKRTK